MNELERKAVVAGLIEKMNARGSWCGETHIQKTWYFIAQLFRENLGLDYILYKHGPYSFDLHELLMEMRADDFLGWQVRYRGYGPSWVCMPLAVQLKSRYFDQVASWEDRFEFIVERVACKTVAELERMATALYILREEKLAAVRAPDRLVELKPHVELREAQEAVGEVLRVLEEVARWETAS